MDASSQIGSGWMRLARIIGGMLLISGVVAIALQVSGSILPITDQSETTAIVMSKNQRGTFQDPAFSITLSYGVKHASGEREMIRSGRRVDYQHYYALSEGDTVTIHYKTTDVYDWRIVTPIASTRPSDYAWELLIILMGLFLFGLPTIVRVAVRADEFEFNPADEVKVN